MTDGAMYIRIVYKTFIISTIVDLLTPKRTAVGL